MCLLSIDTPTRNEAFGIRKQMPVGCTKVKVHSNLRSWLEIVLSDCIVCTLDVQGCNSLFYNTHRAPAANLQFSSRISPTSIFYFPLGKEKKFPHSFWNHNATCVIMTFPETSLDANDKQIWLQKGSRSGKHRSLKQHCIYGTVFSNELRKVCKYVLEGAPYSGHKDIF